jgi:hypothetical protein
MVSPMGNSSIEPENLIKAIIDFENVHNVSELEDILFLAKLTRYMRQNSSSINLDDFLPEWNEVEDIEAEAHTFLVESENTFNHTN